MLFVVKSKEIENIIDNENLIENDKKKELKLQALKKLSSQKNHTNNDILKENFRRVYIQY